MRFALLLILLTACGSQETAQTPPTPDTGVDVFVALDVPCGGACGPGTVCEKGRCVPVDAGSAMDILTFEDRADVGVATLDDGPADAVYDRPEERSPPADDGSTDVPVTEACAGQTVGNCCGVACATPANAMTAACRAGRCVVGVCSAGFADCDGEVANGCEVNLATDNANCGACRAPCAAGRHCAGSACALGECSTIANCPADRHAVYSCVANVCMFNRCVSGFADCDNVVTNGCETNISTDNANCGRCGAVCMLDSASAGCEAGACRIVQCDRQFEDCNRIPRDGCEVSLSSNINCGACGVVCRSPQSCTSSGATFVCR